MFTFSRRVVLSTLMLLPPLGFAQTADLPAANTFARGESWEWRQVDTRTNLEESRLVRTVVEVDGVLQFSNGSTTAPIERSLVGGAYEVSDKPWRRWPLEVGRKWNFDG